MALCAQLILLTQLIPVARAAGVTWYVATNGSDSNSCQISTSPCRTVQAAIAKATDGDTISIASGVYPTNVVINKLLTLVGSGAGTTILDGGKADRVVAIGSNVTVSIVGLTIRNGDSITSSTPQSGGGGGNLNDGILTLLSVVVEQNRATAKDGSGRAGGGIHNRNILTITNSTITNNLTISNSLATFKGGGIENGDDASKTITVLNSTISDNENAFEGGGISNGFGTVSIAGSTISGNRALFGGRLQLDAWQDHADQQHPQ